MSHAVTVLPFERTIDCDDGESILHAVLRHGLFVKYGCGHGGCGTCKAQLVDGDVEGEGSSFALPTSDRADGAVLLCSARPTTRCVVDVSSMELTEEEFEDGDQVRTFEAELVGMEQLTADIRWLSLGLHDPREVGFTAGQFINLEIPGMTEVRPYSIANAPEDTERVDLIVKLLPGGLFSDHIQSKLAIGDMLRFFGPLGDLKLRLSYRQVLMVAGGSGLAPFLSMLEDLDRKGKSRAIDLVFGARRRRDLYRLSDLERLTASLPSSAFIPALSEPDGEDWSGETGTVTEVIARRYTSLAGYDAYLAGPPPMIEATIPLLLDRGVRPANINYDAFVPAARL